MCYVMPHMSGRIRHVSHSRQWEHFRLCACVRLERASAAVKPVW